MFAIAPTDKKWFNFLRSEQTLRLINFWTPTPWNVRQLTLGEFFMFMLKSPIRKIGGFGTFVGYENMLASQAWARFGQGNGVRTLHELVDSTTSYAASRSTNFLHDVDQEIGCILLEDPVFFEDADFMSVEQLQVSFHPAITKLKYFDGTPNLAPTAPEAAGAHQLQFELVGKTPTDYTDTKRKTRKGTRQFRNLVLDTYGNRCCITGETCQDALDVAHIEPYVDVRSNHIQNGIPLRVDLHRLFDNGLISIASDFTLCISPLLTSDNYRTLAGHQLLLPTDPANYPSEDALELHRREIFRG